MEYTLMTNMPKGLLVAFLYTYMALFRHLQA